MSIKRCLSFLLTLGIAWGLVGAAPVTEALTVSPVKLELRGDPGDTVGSSFQLINEQDKEATFYVSYANFEAQGEDGTPAFVETANDLATWIKLVPGEEHTELNSVTLAAGASQEVYFEVEIPEDAQPGGHFAAIFWGTSPEVEEDSQELGLGAKVGILVFLSVNGLVSEEGGLLEFGLTNETKVYTTLPVDFYYRFQNDGGDRMVPQGMISIENTARVETDKFSANPAESNVLPLSVRRFEVSWGTPSTEENLGFWDTVKVQWKQFAFGYYTANLTLTYGSEQELVSSEVGFWVLPWQLLLVLFAGGFLLLSVATFIIRRYNRWIIGQAIAAQKASLAKKTPSKKKRP